MAKRATLKVQKGDQIVLDDSGDDELPEDTDELRALAEMDGGGDMTFQVWRVLPVTEKGFVGQLAASELTVEKIQQDFGKGRYRIRAIRSNGTYAKQNTIDIAAPPRGFNPAAPPPPASSAPTSIQDYISMMDAREQSSSQRMREWAAILIPACAPIVASMIGNKGPTLAELTTSLANIKALEPKEHSQLSQIEQMAKMIEAVKGIGDDGDKTGSTWVDLIRDGIKELGPAVAAIAQNKIPGLTAGVPIAPPPAPVPAQISNNPAPVASKGDPMMQLLSWLREQLAGLVHQASMNKDPGLYAEVVVDNIPMKPDGTFVFDPKILKDFLASEDWWSRLSGFFPAANAYPQWFGECRAAILTDLDRLIAEMSPPPPRNGAGGKTSQPKGAHAAMPRAEDNPLGGEDG